jgi:hypothetical protein
MQSSRVTWGKTAAAHHGSASEDGQARGWRTTLARKEGCAVTSAHAAKTRSLRSKQASLGPAPVRGRCGPQQRGDFSAQPSTEATMATTGTMSSQRRRRFRGLLKKLEGKRSRAVAARGRDARVSEGDLPQWGKRAEHARGARAPVRRKRIVTGKDQLGGEKELAELGRYFR